MIQLRPYQSRGIADIRAAFRTARRVLGVFPTGAGKTTIIASIVQDTLARGSRVVIMAHREELITQIRDRLALFGIVAAIIKAGHPEDPNNPVQVASVQSLAGRLDRHNAPDLLIVDEAHHTLAATYRSILDAWSKSRVLGLTATPWRLDGRGLGEVFESMVQGPTVAELIEQGHLVRARVLGSTRGLDLSDVATRGGDFDIEALEKAIARAGLDGDAVRTFKTHFPTSGTAVAFCVSVKHAERVAAAFNDAGIPAAVLTGADKEAHRKRVLEDLAAGRIRVLCSVDVISEGFDLPAISAVILLRPTKSLSLFLQQVGRALRPAPGKLFAWVFDHAGNSLRHGHPESFRDWTLDAEQPAKRALTQTEDGMALTVRQCLSCYAIHATAPVCPFCGTEHPVDDRIPRWRAVELRELERAELEATDEAKRKAERKAQGGARTVEQLTALFMRQGANRWKAQARAKKVVEAREAKERAERETPLLPGAAEWLEGML
jgi:superfamily II DNA or RNA helicase